MLDNKFTADDFFDIYALMLKEQGREQYCWIPVSKEWLNKYMITDIDRLNKLLEITDKESEEGNWRVTLDYDNYQDGARIVDGDKNILSECYDIDLSPEEQFREAIDILIRKDRIDI